MPVAAFPIGTPQSSQDTAHSTDYTQLYSGVVVNQNVPPLTRILSPGPWYQTFTLPSNYVRADSLIPSLTGFQVFISTDSVIDPTLTWTLDRYVDGTGWIPQTSGSATGSATHGDETWVTIYFPKPITLQASDITERFRFGITLGTGATAIWYSAPNPLSTTFDKLYTGDGSTPVVDVTYGDVSLLFRVLADVADEGIDFLGNIYRSGVATSTTSEVATVGGDRDQYWLSAPQPSQFAVISQYFNMTQAGGPVVIDSVLIDPITPGVFAHVYYSNEGDPGTSPDDWDNKLWTPIDEAFQLSTRTNFYFPKPITAKYVKVEYSHLQAQYYAAGDFQKPMIYKKHPKWVTDYFLARILNQNTEDPLVPRRVQVIYDMLDFAYNYYTDDITSAPAQPPNDDSLISKLKAEDSSLMVDSDTLAKIRTVMQPYLDQPALLGRSDYLIGQYVSSSTPATDYSTEVIDKSRAFTEEVSSLERTPVIVEKSYPVMFFYLTCRHAYRVAAATFEKDRAYFVGINEIAFSRTRFNSASDTDLYIESVGDLVNVQRNDFETVDFTWVTYRDS
jgi:hypothetical protein